MEYQVLKTNKSEDGNFINYLSDVTSLKNITIVFVAARLWNDPDVKRFMTKSYIKYDKTPNFILIDYKEVEKIMLRKVDGFVLPKTLVANFPNLIWYTGIHLNNFLIEINVVHSTIDFFFGRKSAIHWEMYGAIDKVKSVDKLIKHEISRENKRELTFKSSLFQLACNYCLKEHVSSLWFSMSGREQRKFRNIHQDYKFHLVAYWIAVMKSELFNLMKKIRISDNEEIYKDNLTLSQNMVSLSIYNGYPFAMKYFWHQLKQEEKEPHFNYWLVIVRNRLRSMCLGADCFSHTYIICFLLSQLNEPALQRKVLLSEEVDKDVILYSLYRSWPLKKYFLPTLLVMQDNLDEKLYEGLLQIISKEIYEPETLYYLREIWYIIPSRIKTSFLRNLESCPKLISDLIALNDFATITLLLNKASSEQKKTILFKMIDFRKFYPILYDPFIDVILSPRNSKSFDKFLSITLQRSSDIFCFKLKLFVKHCDYLFIAYDLKPQEKFLSWVHKLLNELPDSREVAFNTVKVFTAFVFLNNYDFVDKFMNWAYRNEADIYRFKKSLHNDDNNQMLLPLMNAFSRMGEEGWKRCKKFLSYTFPSLEDINQFKNTYLNKLRLLLKDAKNFLNKLDFCNLFLNWSINSSCEIIQFKKNLLLSTEVVECWYRILLSDIKKNSVTEWLSVKDKLKWFCPSSETITEFKKLFCAIRLFGDFNECEDLCSLRYKKKVFNCLLDRLFEEIESSKVDNNSGSNLDLGHLLNEFSTDYTTDCIHGVWDNFN